MAVASSEFEQETTVLETSEHNDIKCWQGFDTKLMLDPFSMPAIALKWLSFNGPVVTGPSTTFGFCYVKVSPMYRQRGCDPRNIGLAVLQ